MGIGAAMLGAAAVGAAGSYFGSKAQADASKNAASLQNQQYQQNKALLSPFVQTGTDANTLYGNITGVNGASAQSTALNNLAQSPFMAQMQNTANQQTLAAAGKSGAGVSGNALNALWSQNASLENAALTQQENMIGNQAQMGLQAGSALAGVGANAAQSQGNFLTQAGQATGAGYAGIGNAAANGLNNAGLMYALSSRGTGAGGAITASNPAGIASATPGWLNSISSMWS